MNLAAVITMYALFMGIGWAASRKVKEGTAADMIVAGRSIPMWMAVLTMTATWVDGGYLLGTAEGAFKSSVASGVQGGLCFGISLVLGGIFFAGIMRRYAFTTLIDPFEARFGKWWAAVLFIPAMLGEVFWSAELLVAIGSTFGVMLGVKLTVAIVLSALVVTAYTMLGGMWSVAWTDAFQLGLVVLGLLIVLPLMLDQTGGLAGAWAHYEAARPDRAAILPPFAAGGGFWTTQSIINWWDVSVMLICGGIPWNCYFQRVLSCQTPRKAQWHSVLAGLLTIAITFPP
ncbi:MAG: sodium:solute symporter family transporter, partial [Blastocatellia bacterium]